MPMLFLVPCAMQSGSNWQQMSVSEGHVCTHQQQGNHSTGQDGERSTAGSDGARQRRTLSKRGRNQQPKLGVIKQYMVELESSLDKYTDATATLCAALTTRAEKDEYQDLLLVWVEHCEGLKERAREVILVLEAAVGNRNANEESATE